jgi:hypothetical protein
MTLIVWLSRDSAGRLSGVVERDRTGEKEHVHAIDEVNRDKGKKRRQEPFLSPIRRRGGA